MRAKHYYTFEKEIQSRFRNGSLNEQNWDILRTDDRNKDFSIEKNVEDYERNCRNAVSYRNAAEKICDLVESCNHNFNKIISLGVGKGILEWHLKRMLPDMFIECTDYTIKSLAQLKKVSKDVDSIHEFDVLHGDYTELDRDSLFLMYRVSTEFSYTQWLSVFEKMYHAGIPYILFIPTGLDSLYGMLRENIKHMANRMRRRKDIHCGWLYSEDEFEKMFQGGNAIPLYKIKERIYFDNTVLFFLEKTKTVSLHRNGRTL